jgi:rod shape-determining protein MreD
MCLVVIGAFFVQSAIVPHISVMGAKPDIILIVASLYGFTYGPASGSLTGFIGGLLGDLLAGPHVGIGLLSKTIVGFFAGLVRRAVFLENMMLPMLAIFVATWLNEFIYVGFLFLLGETVPIKIVSLQVILPSAIYNALLAPFVYVLVHRFMVIREEASSVRIANKYDSV